MELSLIHSFPDYEINHNASYSFVSLFNKVGSTLRSTDWRKEMSRSNNTANL